MSKLSTIAIEIQKIVRCDGYTTYIKETEAIVRILEKLSFLRDFKSVNHVENMAAESLPPDEFENLVKILNLLKDTRRALHCPICESPLEDNGNCSDVGNNNCLYML